MKRISVSNPVGSVLNTGMNPAKMAACCISSSVIGKSIVILKAIVFSKISGSGFLNALL